MKSAREPASSHPKPRASLKKPHESCTFALLVGPRRKKNDSGQTSAFPSETSRFAPLILAHRGSALPWLVDDRAALPAFAKSGAYPPNRALPGSPRQCSLPHACPHTCRRALNWSSEEARPCKHHPQHPYRRRVSTDRLNCEGSQLAASLDSEPGPTPPGKILPHKYPETRFRRERAARYGTVSSIPEALILNL